MNYYGTQTPNHPLEELLAKVGSLPVEMVLFHPVVPLGSKQCQWPGSIKVQAVSPNKTVYTAIRLYDGSVRFQGC